jgi:hypothetical protein
MQRKPTLAETLTDVYERIERYISLPRVHEVNRPLGINDSLLVPEMHWRIDHHFVELEGKRFANASLRGLPLIQARQIIAFDLDRRGAHVQSEAGLVAASSPQHYEFGAPFLLFLKKRGARHPFFVMWVDNTELLARR